MFICGCSSYQSPWSDPGSYKKIDHYHQEKWGRERGLPDTTINSIIQTRDHYIWLGTLAGPVRFDGVRFVLVDNSENEALKIDNVFSLLEDSEGTIWGQNLACPFFL